MKTNNIFLMQAFAQELGLLTKMMKDLRDEMNLVRQ